jgi:ubiquinone/menaquinone biosynthesis C-methylase UbiE
MEILHRELDPEKTKANFRRVAWFYDFWSWLTESEAAKHVIEFADINDGEAVIEVACGTGVVFEEIVKKNPHGTNIGVDLSMDMLNKAKRRLEKTEYNNYELGYGNALHLDFDDCKFDLVVNNFMVDLMPYDAFGKIAEEFYRITRPNGRVVISTFAFGKKKINKFWFWVAKNFPNLLTGCRPVSFTENLIKVGFEIEKSIEISQNTFPSEVINARKPIANRR